MDQLHKQFVDNALTNGLDTEFDVKMSYGELILFHVLLQDYALPMVGEERFIPLMERNKKRIEKANDA